jgi:hypothetical protein
MPWSLSIPLAVCVSSTRVTTLSRSRVAVYNLLNSCLFTAAEKLFGYSRGEVVKQNVRMLMPNEVAEHHGELLASCPLQAT